MQRCCIIYLPSCKNAQNRLNSPRGFVTEPLEEMEENQQVKPVWVKPKQIFRPFFFKSQAWTYFHWEKNEEKAYCIEFLPSKKNKAEVCGRAVAYKADSGVR